MSNKIRMIKVRDQVDYNYHYSFLRTICNILGQPREETPKKLFSIIDNLCTKTNKSISQDKIKKFMDSSELFKNERLSQFYNFERLGLIHIKSSNNAYINNGTVTFNNFLFNVNENWEQPILEIKIENERLSITNKSNGFTLYIPNFTVEKYITFITNLQKRQKKNDKVIYEVLDLFIKNKETGEDQLKTDKVFNHLSIEMGYGKELLRNKLLAMKSTGLILEYDTPFNHETENGINYLPSKYYLNSEILTLDEYNGIKPLSKVFDVVINKQNATLIKRN